MIYYHMDYWRYSYYYILREIFLKKINTIKV